jgi:hypothetical protein
MEVLESAVILVKRRRRVKEGKEAPARNTCHENSLYHRPEDAIKITLFLF